MFGWDVLRTVFRLSLAITSRVGQTSPGDDLDGVVARLADDDMGVVADGGAPASFLCRRPGARRDEVPGRPMSAGESRPRQARYVEPGITATAGGALPNFSPARVARVLLAAGLSAGTRQGVVDQFGGEFPSGV
jgi:hypothetical protein